MMRRMALSVVFCLLIINATLVAAQAQAQPAIPLAVQVPVEQAQRAQADVRALGIVRQLGLTNEQLQGMLPLLDNIQQQQQAKLAALDLLWQQNQAAIQGVIDSWVAGKAPTAGAINDATAAATQVRQQNDLVEQAVGSAAGGIRALLQPQQMAMVETPDQYAKRLHMQASLDGASSIAEYIVMQLDTQRTLMPDEYRAVRLYSAGNIASEMEPANSPRFAQARGAILDLMDTVKSWPDAQYTQQRPTLIQQVAQTLNLSALGSQNLVKLDELDTFLRSPRTPQVLAEALGNKRTGEAAAAWKRHDMEQALSRSDVVALFNTLQLDLNQLGGLQPLTNQAAGAIRTRDTNRDGALSKAGASLVSLRGALLVGSLADPYALTPFADLQKTLSNIDLDGKAAVGISIGRMQQLLYLAQAAMVDFTAPPEVAGHMDPQLRAARERDRASRVSAIMRFFDSIRNLIEPLFTQALQGRCGDFAAQYFDPQSRDFSDAVDYMMRAARRMKIISVRDWVTQKPDFAAQVGVDLGIISTEAPPPAASEGQITWNQLYDVFANPDTPELVQLMIRERTGGAH